MAKRILVPLDLDDRAEAVVPIIAEAARQSGATVRLLHVAPVPVEQRGEFGRVVVYADQEMARMTAEATDHLSAVETQLTGVPVEIVVRFGDVADEILAEAAAFEADLIAMTAPRVNRLRWAIAGGVAERVFRASPTPVLLLREGALLRHAA